MKKHDPSAVIFAIDVIRQKNNSLWMSILRLAFKHAPKDARKIMKQIAKNDKEINQWMGRL